MSDEQAVEHVPLWERLPPRPLSAREVAAALPEKYPSEKLCVYALDPLENDTFRRLLIDSVRWHSVVLTSEGGEPFQWERVGTTDGEFNYTAAPRVVADSLGWPSGEVARIAYPSDIEKRRMYLPDEATMYGYDGIPDSTALTVRVDLAVEAAKAKAEVAEDLFEAFGPAIEAMNEGVSDMADAFAPVAEAMRDDIADALALGNASTAAQTAADIEETLAEYAGQRGAVQDRPNASVGVVELANGSKISTENFSIEVDAESLTASVEAEALSTEAAERLSERARTVNVVRGP